MNLRFVSFFAFALPACLTSTGAVGTEGNVRFSQVQHFVETTDFAPPVVTESGLLVELELPNDAEQVNPALTLIVADGEGTSPSANAEVVPLGFAQYAITLHKAGAFTLVARDDDNVFDTLAIRAAGMSTLRFHDQVDRTINDDSGSSSCVSSDQVDLASAVLTSDTRLDFHVVPADGSNDAMLGLLELTATATGPIEILGDYLGQGLAPNSFTVVPQGTLGAPATITVKDEISGMSTTFTLPTKDENTSCQ
jgi:hypothetical protein